MHVNVFEFSKLLARSSERYLESVRVSGFSVGIYVLDRGAMDHQKPHSEDEVYYAASGRAKMKTSSSGDSSIFDVGPGTIIYVPAQVHHSFYDFLRNCRAPRTTGVLRPCRWRRDACLHEMNIDSAMTCRNWSINACCRIESRSRLPRSLG